MIASAEKPLKNKTLSVPLNENTFGDEEIYALIELLKAGHLTMGAECFKFEEQFAQYLGVKNAIMVNSGSSANLLAFFALVNPLIEGMSSKKRVVPGQEIIVPALTWSTSVWPIIQIGCIPIFVDSNPATLQMDLNAVEAAINKNTAAICAPHILGNAIDLKRLKDIAEKNNLWLIEDTCEGLGVKNHDAYAGTVGDMGTYSFFFSHHITTIEGGMIITNNGDIADLLRSLRAHGWVRHMKNKDKFIQQHPEIDPRFLFVSSGFNVRPTDLNGRLGQIQLKKLASFNQRRTDIAARWNHAFSDLIQSRLLMPMQMTDHTESAWFGYPVLCQDTATRDAFQTHLENNHIETRPIICGNLQRQPAFKHYAHKVHGQLAGADKVMDTGLYWASHPVMNEAQIQYVINVVKDFFK